MPPRVRAAVRVADREGRVVVWQTSGGSSRDGERPLARRDRRRTTTSEGAWTIFAAARAAGSSRRSRRGAFARPRRRASVVVRRRRRSRRLRCGTVSPPRSQPARPVVSLRRLTPQVSRGPTRSTLHSPRTTLSPRIPQCYNRRVQRSAAVGTRGDDNRRSRMEATGLGVERPILSIVGGRWLGPPPRPVVTLPEVVQRLRVPPYDRPGL
jgi:hypothetical protein